MNKNMLFNTYSQEKLISFVTENSKYACIVLAIWAIHDLCVRAMDKNFSTDVTISEDNIKLSFNPSISTK